MSIREKTKGLEICTRPPRGLVGTLCGACIVTLVALCLSAAPARAQANFNPLPPQVAFISVGKFSATLKTKGNSLPLTGSIAYLTGDIAYEKISVDPTGAQLITSDTWLVLTSQSINEWEIVSTFPNTCRQEVLSPKCTGWARTPRGIYVQKCTVTAQGNKTTLNFAVQLSSNNKLVQMSETSTIEDENGNTQGNLIPVKDVLTGDVIFVTNSLVLTMTSQGTTPPVPSDFNRPDICNAPTVSNQSQNDNSQGNDLGCTGTIPNICF
jgi:hypothetical protein